MTNIKVAAGLDQILAQRNAIAAKIEEIGRLMDETEALVKNSDFCRASGGHGPMWLYGKSDFMARNMVEKERFQFVSRSIKGLDLLAWEHLFKAIGYERFLDSKRRGELYQQLQNGQFEPLTEANAQATFSALFESKEKVLREGIVELFHRLSRDYKTNLPRMFGPKLVVENVVHQFFGRIVEGGAAGRGNGDELNDLLRFMNAIDNRPEEQMFTAWLASQLAASQSLVYQHDFFEVKCFKKGSVHLRFKRMDLVERLNQVLAHAYPNALPATTA